MANEKKTPFYGNFGTGGTGRPEFERFEITVRGRGGDSEALAKKVASAVKNAKDVDDLEVVLREGGGANPRVRDMLADERDPEGTAAEVEEQERARTVDIAKETKRAKDRGVAAMPTPEERVAGTTAAKDKSKSGK